MAADGHTYERKAITDWFITHNTSPNTREILRHKELTPNHCVRSLALRFRDECRDAGIDPDSLA